MINWNLIALKLIRDDMKEPLEMAENPKLLFLLLSKMLKYRWLTSGKKQQLLQLINKCGLMF